MLKIKNQEINIIQYFFIINAYKRSYKEKITSQQ